MIIHQKWRVPGHLQALAKANGCVSYQKLIFSPIQCLLNGRWQRPGGEFAETSKADKAAATKRKKAKAVDRRVPAACWGMFKAYLGAEGENFGKQEPTLADLIQLVIEGAGGVIDTTNWVAYHVSLHLVVV